MESDIAKRNTLMIGLAVLGSIGIVSLLGVSGGYQSVVSYLHELQRFKTPQDDPDYMYARALDYQHDGNMIFATASARRAEIIDPEYVPARKFLAAVALKNKDYSEAIAQCQGILNKDPNDSNAQLGLATAYRGAGEPAKAETEYQQVMDNAMNEATTRSAAHDALKGLQTAAPTTAGPTGANVGDPGAARP